MVRWLLSWSSTKRRLRFFPTLSRWWNLSITESQLSKNYNWNEKNSKKLKLYTWFTLTVTFRFFRISLKKDNLSIIRSMWFHWVKSQLMWWLNLERIHNLSKESKLSNNSTLTSVCFRITKSDSCHPCQTVSVAHFRHKIKKSIKILLPLRSMSLQLFLRRFPPFTSFKSTTTSQPKIILPKR